MKVAAKVAALAEVMSPVYKTAAIKDQLSDTVYQPKDPYLKKFYTGEISDNDVEKYINSKEKDLYFDKLYSPSHNNRSFKDERSYAIPGKYDKLRTATTVLGGLGVIGAVPSMLASPVTMKPLAISAGLIGAGVLGNKLIPQGPQNISDRSLHIQTDKLIQNFEWDRPTHKYLADAGENKKIDEYGYFSNAQDEKKYFDKYRKLFKTVDVPYTRSFNVNEKTAALAEELNPVPKRKQERSVFQKFVDTLSTNKAKHVGGTVGGVAGMIAGRELLHSNLTPMRALGGVGVVGGAALGAKNIYGLYNDYFD